LKKLQLRWSQNPVKTIITCGAISLSSASFSQKKAVKLGVCVCVCVQGVSDSPCEERRQNGTCRRRDAQVNVPSSKRLYNWNTTHFYPDVHDLDENELSTSRHRRHSETRCFPRSVDNVSSDQQQSSDSSSSVASSNEVKGPLDAIMPISQLTLQLSSPHAATGAIAKVDVDLDSGSESEDDSPKTWHRSPLHVRRGRRSVVSGHSGKKTDLDSTVAAEELWKQAAQRPSMKFKEQAEKRRKFLQQRCQMYGWDLTADQEQQSAVDGHMEEQQRHFAASQSQEDICYIDQSPKNSVVNEDVTEHVSVGEVSAVVSQLEVAETLHALMDSSKKPCTLVCDDSTDVPCPVSTSANFSVKESSSFENIYDTVSLEPDMSSDDFEVVQLYESRQAKFDDSYHHAKPLSSNELPSVDLRPFAQRENNKSVDGFRNLPSNAVAATSLDVAACDTSAARPSSAPNKSLQKSNHDAKSIVEEEKVKFVEYRIEYRRHHSSGNDIVSGKSSSGKEDTTRQLESTDKPHKAIPPDDYEYILRKIHHNRPQNVTGQKFSAAQPCGNSRGSELHIEIKKPQTTTQHVTVDFAKPSVPHRVESLQLDGSHCQLPARPDVIPSPNYISSSSATAGNVSDGVHTGSSSSGGPVRTVLRSVHQPLSSRPSELPTAFIEQDYAGLRKPAKHRLNNCESSCFVASVTTSQNTEPDRKPPKPPRTRSPDFWHYNTTYEPSSPSWQPQLPLPTFCREQEMFCTSEPDLKDSARPLNQDLVHDLVRGLSGNSELTPAGKAVFREQYRLSIHEPCPSVKPDQFKHDQLSQLPCSQVFSSSVYVQSNPVQLVDETASPSLKESSKVCSSKETVFSVTGYHKPKEHRQKSSSVDAGLLRRTCLKDAIVSGPLHRCSEAEKRKPIINSPEVETALNRDCHERYIYCSGRRMNGEKSVLGSSWKESQSRDDELGGWKRGLSHRTERDAKKDDRLQKSQDRLVQQMSLGSEELMGHLDSKFDYSVTRCQNSHPQKAPVYTQDDCIRPEKSANEPDGQPAVEIGRRRGQQSAVASSGHMLSRASTDYDKHVLHVQESYRSQVMAQIEPLSSTSEDKCLNAENCQSMATVLTMRDKPTFCSAGIVATSESGATRRDAEILSDRYMNMDHDNKFYQERSEVDEDPYPVSVAEIKAKLFGPNEDGAGKIFQRQSDADKGRRADRDCNRAGGGTQHCQFNRQKKQPFVSDELTDFERFVDRLDKQNALWEAESHLQLQSASPTVIAAQCSLTSDTGVKRSSVTDFKGLEDSISKQPPSLEGAKEWLVNGMKPSTYVHKGQSYAAVENTMRSAVDCMSSVENFISHKSSKSLPCTESEDVCRSVVGNSVSSTGVSVLAKPCAGMQRSTTSEAPVALRCRPAGHLSSIHRSFSNSFARRSLPALTEKDSERWQNMVSRIQENESRRDAKSRSVERLSQPFSDPGVHSVSTRTPMGTPAAASVNAELKPALSAHTTSDTTLPPDTRMAKPKRQQTPRDVKSRDEFRMRGIRAHTDSGYIGSESDSHGSSGVDVSKRLPSESNESDELELQRYTYDEDDDINIANVDSAFVLPDEVSPSDLRVITEFPENESKQLHKLRQDWFGEGIQQSHSSSFSDKSVVSYTPLSYTLNKDVAFEHSDLSLFRKNAPLNLGLPKERSTKPLYVSPLAETFVRGIYRGPSSGGDNHCSTTVASTEPSCPSKISSLKMMLPSQQPGLNSGSRGTSTVVACQSSTVTPSKTEIFHIRQSPTRCSAFSPYVDRRDMQMSRRSSGSANVTKVKRELLQDDPEQRRAGKRSEGTVVQPFCQLESEQSRFQCLEVKVPHVKVVRQVTDSKTGRLESHMQPKASPLNVRNEIDKFETSDGEMTDATDITLDVMVGANQSLTPTVEFSDVEFLSSANLPAKVDTSFVEGAVRPCVLFPPNKSLANSRGNFSDDGSGDATVAVAKAEMQLYKRNAQDVKTEPPVERRRSIKELVHSFEGMTSPFLRTRPRSMEIRISPSSDEDNQHNDNASGREHKNVVLRASSSFKEATRLDRKNRLKSATSQ